MHLAFAQVQAADEISSKVRIPLSVRLVEPAAGSSASASAHGHRMKSVEDLKNALEEARGKLFPGTDLDSRCKLDQPPRLGVTTKEREFFRPVRWEEPGRARLLELAQLVANGNQGDKHRIALVTGPLGSGKSTAIRGVLQALHLVSREATTKLLSGYFARPPVVYVRNIYDMYSEPPSETKRKGYTLVVVPPVLLLAEVLRAHGVEGVGGLKSNEIVKGVPSSLCWGEAAFDTDALTEDYLTDWLNFKRLLPVVAVDEFPQVYKGLSTKEFGDTWHEQLFNLSMHSSMRPMWLVMSGSAATGYALLAQATKIAGTAEWTMDRMKLHQDRLDSIQVGPVQSREDLVWMLQHATWPDPLPAQLHFIPSHADHIVLATPNRTAGQDSSHTEAKLFLRDVLLATSGLPRSLEEFVSSLGGAGADALLHKHAVVPLDFRGECSALPVALALACEAAPTSHAYARSKLSEVIRSPFSTRHALSSSMVPLAELVESLNKVLEVSEETDLGLKMASLEDEYLRSKIFVWAETGALQITTSSSGDIANVGFGNVGTAMVALERCGPLLELHPEIVRQMVAPSGTLTSEYGECIFLASLCDRTIVDGEELNHLGLLLKEHGKVHPEATGPLWEGGAAMEEVIEQIGKQELRWTYEPMPQLAALKEASRNRAVLHEDTVPEPGVLYSFKLDSGVDITSWLLIKLRGAWILVEVMMQVKQTGRDMTLSQVDAYDAVLRIARVRFTRGLDSARQKVKERAGAAVAKDVTVTGLLTNREPASQLKEKLLEMALQSKGSRSGMFWLPRAPLKAGQEPPSFDPSAPDLELWAQHGGGSGAASPARDTFTVDMVPVKTGDGGEHSGALVPRGGIGLLAGPSEMRKYWCAPVRVLADQLRLESYGGVMKDQELAAVKAKMSIAAMRGLALMVGKYKSKTERQKEEEEAEERRREAKERRREAEEQRKEAEERRKEADEQRKEAEERRKEEKAERQKEEEEAEERRRKAEEQRKEAEERRKEEKEKQREAEQWQEMEMKRQEMEMKRQEMEMKRQEMEMKRQEMEMKRQDTLAKEALEFAGLSPEDAIAAIGSGRTRPRAVLGASEKIWQKVVERAETKFDEVFRFQLEEARKHFQESLKDSVSDPYGE